MSRFRLNGAAAYQAPTCPSWTAGSAFQVFSIFYGKNDAFLRVAAFVGAIATATLIERLTSKGGINPNCLILVGLGVGASVSAMTTFMVVRAAEVWTMRSRFGNNWLDVKTIAICLAIMGLLGVMRMWPLCALHLGDDVTCGLGVPVEQTRFALLLVGRAPAAVSVSAAGPIGFFRSDWLLRPHGAAHGPDDGRPLFQAASWSSPPSLATVFPSRQLPGICSATSSATKRRS
jgi:ABC-type enterobactin transport system permease subunit